MQKHEAIVNKHKEYIEDLENGYDRIATLHHSRRENDNDSIRRHEIDRGSEGEGFIKSDIDKHAKSDNKKRECREKAHGQSSIDRDQFFIKEGNTEILRLVTRGKNEEERYVNLPTHQQRPTTMIPQTQYVVVDNGKDLLMERFIREQGEEANNIRERMGKVTDLDNISTGKDGRSVGLRSHVGSDAINQFHDYSNVNPDVPGVVPLKADYLQSALLEMQNKSTIHQELLESSLRKQNELLHQILIERERLLHNQETASQVESKLETQSLPGHSVIATQTECHIGTQTEPQILQPARRKARSDNDSYSEEESQVVDDDTEKGAWVKRKKSKKKLKHKDPRRSLRVYDLNRKIKTPIIEESDVSPSLESENHIKISKTNEREEHIKKYGDKTKSVVTTSKNETVCSTQIKVSESEKKSKLRKDILMEISDSLDEKVDSDYNNRRQKLQKKISLIDGELSSAKSRLALEQEESKTGSSSTSKDHRNLIFSRQGSSTDARDEAELLKLESHEIDDTVSKQEISSYTETNKNVTLESNEPVKPTENGKSTQKSLPRYMQWYGKKSNVVAKPTVLDKVVPSKPKRLSKTKNEPESKEKNSSYGKIISKENTEVKKNAKGKESEFIHPRILKEGKVTPVPEGPLPDVHPLLQHSQHRFERQYENQNPLCYIQPTHIPKYLKQHNVPILAPRQSVDQPIYVNQEDVKNKDEKQDISESALTHSISISTSYGSDKKTTSEVHVSKINIGGDTDVHRNITTTVDDNDSGIAMNALVQQAGNIKRLPITEKKSVFTIAYDDVQTKQLRPDSSSTSY